MESLALVHFDWPWVFVLLPLPYLYQRHPRSLPEGVIDIPPLMASMLDALNHQQHTRVSHRRLLHGICWLAILCALAQPWQQGKAIAYPASGRALTLIIDVSASMERKDLTLDGQARDRLTVVKHVASRFIQNRQGDRLGLVIFGKQAFIASPLSFDLTAVNHILNSTGIGMAGRSTAIGDAIGLAIQTLRRDAAQHKAIILLSDGTNNAGSVEPEDAASLAATLGIRIHTIALGSQHEQAGAYRTPASADLDEASLAAIAEASGGRYFRADSREVLESVYAEIDQLERAEVMAPPLVQRQDLKHWPLSVLLVTLLFLSLPSIRHR